MTNTDAIKALTQHVKYWVDPSSPTLAALKYAINALSNEEGESQRNQNLLDLGHPGFSLGTTGWISAKEISPPKDTPFLAGVWDNESEWIHICILESSSLYVIVDSDYRYAAPHTIADIQFWKPIPKLPKLSEGGLWV